MALSFPSQQQERAEGFPLAPALHSLQGGRAGTHHTGSGAVPTSALRGGLGRAGTRGCQCELLLHWDWGAKGRWSLTLPGQGSVTVLSCARWRRCTPCPGACMTDPCLT